MSHQISVPQYSDDPEVQAAFEASYIAAYQSSFPQGHADGLAEGRAAAIEEGKQIGALGERERCTAILGSPEARGRESTAKRFAFETDMTADQAIGVLGTVPKDHGASIAERQKGAIITGPWVA